MTELQLEIQMKICSKCGIKKIISEFHKESKMKDGYRNECKECRNSYRKKMYNQNIEHELQRRKKNREKNIEKERVYDIKRYYEKKESILERMKEYRKNNKDKMMEYNKKHQKELMKNSPLDIKYGSIHDYINSHKIKPKYCIICNERKKLQLANIGHIYTRNLKDYLYLCVSCHLLFDKCLKKRGLGD